MFWGKQVWILVFNLQINLYGGADDHTERQRSKLITSKKEFGNKILYLCARNQQKSQKFDLFSLTPLLAARSRRFYGFIRVALGKLTKTKFSPCHIVTSQAQLFCDCQGLGFHFTEFQVWMFNRLCMSFQSKSVRSSLFISPGFAVTEVDKTLPTQATRAANPKKAVPSVSSITRSLWHVTAIGIYISSRFSISEFKCQTLSWAKNPTFVNSITDFCPNLLPLLRIV